MRKHHAAGSWTLVYSFAAALMLLEGSAFAQSSDTWGVGSGNWSSSASWTNGSPATDGSAALVFGSSSTWTSTFDVAGTTALNSFTFNTPGTITASSTTGNFFNFVNNPATSTPPSILMNSSGTVQVAVPMIVTGNLNVTVAPGAGTLFLGALGTANWFAGGAGNITIQNNSPNPVYCADLGGWNSVGAVINYFNVTAGTVICSDGPAGGGNVFGNFTVLNVSAGATYGFNTNGETMGAIEGLGNIVANSGITTQIPGNFTFGGSVQGGTINQDVAGTLTLSGSNAFVGVVEAANVAGAQLQIANQNAVGNTGVLDILNANGIVFNTNGGTISSFNLGGMEGSGLMNLTDSGGYAVNLTIGANNASTSYTGAIAGIGSLTKVGTGLLNLNNVNSAYTGSTTVSGGSLAIYSSALAAGSGVTLSSGSLQIYMNSNYSPSAFSASANTGLTLSGGAGAILSLAGANAFGGSSLQLLGGGLTIDSTGNNSAKLSASPAFTLGSGTLSLLGNSNAFTAETVTGSTVSGGGQINIFSGNNQNASLNLGAITFAYGSALNVSTSSNGTGVASVTTTTPNSVTGLTGGYGILGGNATVNGTDWATTGTGSGPFTIAPISSSAYAANDAAWTSTALNSSSASSTLAASSTTAALRINGATAPVTLSLSGTNSIATGGLLVTSNNGTGAMTITGGSIAQASGTPLYINQFDTSNNFTIGSFIADNTSGTLAPTMAITATGATTLTVPTAGLHVGMSISGSGIQSGTHIIAITGSNSVSISAPTNAKVASGNTTIFTPDTPIVMSGPGTTVLTAANAVNGGIFLNNGTLEINAYNNLGGSFNPIFFNGGALEENINSGGDTASRAWYFGPAGGTIDVPLSGQVPSKSGTGIFGAGNLIKTGSGTLFIGSNVSTFSGQVFVNQGIVGFTSDQFTSATGMTVASGGQYQINDNATGSWTFASGAYLTLNGTGPNNTGAFALNVQSGTAPNPAPISTFSDPVYLASNSLFTQSSVGETSTSPATATSILIISGAISGPGNLSEGANPTLGSSGILRLTSPANTYGGAAGMTTVLAGTLEIGVSNALPVTTSLVIGDSSANTAAAVDLFGQSQTVASLSTAGNASGNIVVNSGSTASTLTLNYQGNTPMIYTGALGQSSTGNNFAFATTGTGTVVLAGNNFYTQGTTVGPGATLQLGNNGTFGNFAGNIANNGSLQFNLAQGTVIGSVISGSGSVAVIQGGGVALTGPNTYTGPTYVQNGTLVASGSVTSTNSLPATTSVVLGDLNNDSGILQLGDNTGPVNQTVTNLATLGMGNNAIVGGNASNSTLSVSLASNTTYNGTLGGNNTYSNNLALEMSGSSKLTLNGANTYIGATTVNSGILEAGSSTAFSSSSAYVVNPQGTLRISGNSVAVGSIAGAGTIENANASSCALTTGYDNTNTSFSGLIRDGAGGGAFSLMKTGSGTLTLLGNNSYTGATLISGGVLQLAGNTSQASPYTVSNGGALGVSGAANTAILSSSLNFGSLSTDAAALDFSMQGAPSTTLPLLSVSGALTTSGTTTINVASSTLLGIGVYPLMNFSGSILGSGSSAFVLGTLPNARMDANLEDINHTLLLNVLVSADAPRWTGAVSGAWDSTTKNWSLIYAGSSTTYLPGDAVTFDDLATGTTAVTLAQDVQPQSVTFNNNTKTYSLSGNGGISGPASLTMTGTGLVVLANNNTYTGGTTISAGTLQLGDGGASGSITGNVTDNATLVIDRSDTPVYTTAISGSGSVLQVASGLTTFMGSNSYTGGTTISNGTLQIDNGGNTGIIAGNVLDNSALVFARSDNAAFNGAISGSGSLTQAGPGMLVLTANHTYTGPTAVSAGTLQLGNGGASGSLVSNVALTSFGSTLAFARSDSTTYNGTVSGAGLLVQQGPGNLTLTGSNTQSLGTVISGGTLTVGSDANLGGNGSLSSLVFYNSGTLQASGPLELSGGRSIYPNGQTATFNTNGYNVIIDSQIYPGALTGNLVQNGPGTLTLTNFNNSNTSSPPNPGSTFTINNGMLSVGANTAVPTDQLILNGGTLQLTNQMGTTNPNATIGTEFDTAIQVGAQGGTIDTQGNWVSVLTEITNAPGSSGALTKAGSGTLYLIYGLGGSAFSGNLNILSGTVLDESALLVGSKGSTDAISNTTIVNVSAGAVWDDSWGNGEDMGGIAGAGTILGLIGNGITIEASTPTTFSGQLRGAANSVPTVGGATNLTQASGGSITLTGSTSDYGGTTSVTSGSILIGANVFANQPGPVGQASSAVLVGNTTGTSNASLLVNSGGLTFGRNVLLQTGNEGTMTVGATNTSGTVDYTGTIYLGSSGGSAQAITLTAAPGGTVLFSGPLTRNSGATGSSDNVTVIGGGTIVFGAVNNYNGTTLIHNGTLVAAGGNNTLPTTTSVTLGDSANDSGVLQIGSASGPVSQTIAKLATTGNGSGNAVVGGCAMLPSTLIVNATSNQTFGGTLGGSNATANNLNFGISGTKVVTLTGTNTYFGATTVSGGTLAAGSASAFGVGSALTVATGATAFLNGNNLTIGSLAGSGTVTNSNVSATQLTLGADNTNTQFNGLIQDGSGGGSLSLLKIGTGTWTVGGAHTSSGPTSISGGLVQLQDAASLTSPVTVAAGAGFGIAESSAPTTAILNSTLTFGAVTSDTTSLNFNLQGGWSTTTPLLAVSGAVTANGTTTINIVSNSLPSVGEYTLLNYSSLAGLGFNGFTLGSLPSQQMSAQLINNTSTDSVLLDVTAVDSSRWTGAVNNTWDVNTTTNWQLVTAGTATVFNQSDNVVFDDTAGTNTNINLPAVVTPSNVQFNNNSSVYSISGSGNISGVTAVVLTGSGMVTLNTNNDYTGGTTVSNGTLQLGSGGATGSVAGNIANNSLVIFNRSDTPSFSGAISGSGAVAQIGNGMLTLLGTNTYTGGTTVSAGTLQIGNGGFSGSIAGNVANNVTLIFNRADSPVVFAGSISGSGAVVQQGAGTLVLTGSSTYSGGTSINNGSLQIGSGGTAGIVAGNILDNGTLIVNRSDNPTLAGTISGSGSLVQQGAGTLILTASNTYTGQTTIGPGTLQLGNGGTTGSVAGNVTIGGTLAINQSGIVNIGGTLSGPGNLIQMGSGTTMLAAANGYAGGTTISAGVLSISSNQSIGNGPVVLSGGNLQVTSNMGISGDPTQWAGALANAIQVSGTAGTIDTGANWLTTIGAVTGGLGTNVTKIGSGTWYMVEGMGGSGYNGNLNIQAGTVLDDYISLNKGSTDAFGNSTVVTVAPGAVWDDSWGNGEAMGGIAGGGDILMSNTLGDGGITLEAPVNTTFSGRIRAASQSVPVPGGTVTLNQAGGGSITLSGTGSDFAGSVKVTNGTIVVGANVIPGEKGPFGEGNSAVVVGNANSGNNATLLLGAPGVQFGANISVPSNNNAGISTVGGSNASGSVYYTGNITLGSAGGVAQPLTLTAASGGTVEIDGDIADGTGAVPNGDSLTMNGPGTLILANGSNSYAGGLDVAGGTVVLSANGALPDGSPLTVGAGSTLSFDSTAPTFNTLGQGSPIASSTARTVEPVPEPGTLALLAVGAVLVAFRASRRRRS